MQTKTNNQLLNNFLLALQAKEKSPNTINGYEIDIVKFLNYIRESKNITTSIDTFDKEFFNSIKYTDLEFYINYLLSDNKAASTRARTISSIKEFFKYLKNKLQVIDYNPASDLETPKIPEKMPKYKNVKECKTMLQSINSRNKERDFAIITLFINLGLRVSELVGMDITDLDLENSRIRVIRKGNEEKFMRLNIQCIDAINQYLVARPEVEDKALFLSERKQRIRTKTVRYMTKKYGNINPHALRHSCATNLLSTGNVNIREVQDLLNHKNIQTTVRYTHLTEDDMQKTVDANPYY